MKTILLAIDGMTPEKGIVEYAVGLCRRLRAQLDILHLVNPETHGGYAKQLRKETARAAGYFQDAMAAAAFAESGEHDTAKILMKAASEQFRSRLPETEKDRIRYRIKISGKRADREITDYVRENRNIVAAIYEDAPRPDAPEQSDSGESPIGSAKNRGCTPGANLVARRLQQGLSIPVIIRSRCRR